MEKLNQCLNSIEPSDKEKEKLAMKNIDNLAKPLGSLGTLENIVSRVVGITGKFDYEIKKKNIIVMCADNGVVEEGVSTCPKSSTAVLTNNLTKDATGVMILSKFTNTGVTVVDIGVDAVFHNPKIIDKKVARGTRNIAKEPAMTGKQAIKAIEAGIEIVDELCKEGCDLFGTGEMGIGNTTTSAAVLSVLSGLPVEVTTGKGSGLTEAQFINKKEIIKKAISINSPDKNDVIDVLAKVGGFDIAGLCGCFLGAAKNKKPIVIDGFIALAAALCAVRLNKYAKDYMFPSHLSDEPGAKYMLEEIGLEPMLNLHMRLGEGSGCPLAFQIIEAALYTLNNMPTFKEAEINSKDYVDIR
ncbi:nicotinate-nucleotide--dimethylbenzimidazole phosphoribosyltransferase [Clostridium hydrogenum]|uniref:nicotinate-nucleotide--dimethylbenzimidazole phosphoribosyltransferase n=1 Tax=Clostridium hydrogenum TaxID=2855764 RepID=UPI001F30358E|nr:nicotinate-nucleotide--dimethylbenzimidazole phosphoribosyltransferase [Clostridium hydrogenum]